MDVQRTSMSGRPLLDVARTSDKDLVRTSTIRPCMDVLKTSYFRPNRTSIFCDVSDFLRTS